ncbi:hypothetical protein GGI23_000506 [Coemansia sp. RSA 2559]|nr:hypothetical protein GGI23_000506 [Coemansia sp. RSA 2559]KAJ2868880.1 hypothetical protein GGI22_000588 [Coemansia erecta]
MLAFKKAKKRARAKAERKRQQHGLRQSFRLIFGHILSQSTEPAELAHGRRQEPLAQSIAGLQPLTAVCRRWRKATVPLFYQTAVCSIRQQAVQTNGEGKLAAPSLMSSTNVDLIVSGGYERHVRRLAIDLVGDVELDLVAMQLEAAGFSGTFWPQITELQIDHWHGHRQQGPAASPEAAAKLNAYLLHNLPNLVSVEYNSLGDRRAYSEFPLNGLLASSLSRLSKLSIHSGLVPDLGASAFLPALSSLTLNCPMVSCAAHLPRIFAESLVHLRIGFSSAGTIWNRFYGGQGKRAVVFAKLRSLELEYAKPVAEESCSCKGDLAKCTGRQSSLRRSRAYRLAGGLDESGLENGTGKVGGNRLDSVYYHSTSEMGDDDGAFGPDYDYDEFWAASSDDESPASKATASGSEKPDAMRRPLFPHLERLHIRKYPHPLADVLQYFAVAQIPHVSVRDVGRKGWASEVASAECASSMQSLRLDVARSSVHHSRQREDKDARHFQVWVNRLFSMSSATLTRLWLDAPTTEPATLPDIVGLRSLTELSLGMKMDLGSIPNLLARLPRLHKLAIHVHPQSSWSLRNEGVGYGQHEHGALLLGRLPSLSTSLRCLVAYMGMVDLSGMDCRGTHKRNLSSTNKCCRRRCQLCEKCAGMKSVVVPANCDGEYDEDECGTLKPQNDQGSPVAMAVEKELVWMIARIPSLTMLKTERNTSCAMRECIAALMSQNVASQIGHLARLRITEWEY